MNALNVKREIKIEPVDGVPARKEVYTIRIGSDNSIYLTTANASKSLTNIIEEALGFEPKGNLLSYSSRFTPGLEQRQIIIATFLHELGKVTDNEIRIDGSNIPVDGADLYGQPPLDCMAEMSQNWSGAMYEAPADDRISPKLHAPGRVTCPECGDSFDKKHEDAMQGDDDEWYCSISCLREVYR